MEYLKNDDLKESLMRDFPKLICPFDLEEMSCEKIRWVQSSKNKNKFVMPLYKCKTCGRQYTTLDQYDNMASIRFNNDKYLNLKYAYYRKQKNENKSLIPTCILTDIKRSCYVYGVVKTTECRVPGCQHKLVTRSINLVSIEGYLRQRICRICPNCGTIYVLCAEYDTDWYFLKCMNEDELPKLKEAVQKKVEKKRRKKEEEKKKIEKISIHDNTIRIRDFVVRRNVFKCRHHDHKLQNINAVISLVDSAGKILQCTVPAGYCPNCNIFFIMESTYKNLKRKGILLCRVSDEKTYLKRQTFANGMKLAQQSILMQYGYSVAQSADLTSAQRRKILASIIDSGILTKSEIISYLDFFINQHQHQQKNKFAISKWESDRDFVSDYNKQKYKNFGVKEIYR